MVHDDLCFNLNGGEIQKLRCFFPSLFALS